MERKVVESRPYWMHAALILVPSMHNITRWVLPILVLEKGYIQCRQGICFGIRFPKKKKDYALLHYLYTSEKVYWKIYLEDAAQLIMQDLTTLSVEINVKNRIN